MADLTPPSWYTQHVVPLIGVAISIAGFIGYVATTAEAAALITGGGLMTSGAVLIWNTVKAVLARRAASR